MTEDSQREENAGIIIGALQVARERVTASTIDAKQLRRAELKEAISRMMAYQETGEDPLPAAALRELLGDPGDRVIRRALEALDE